MSSAVDAVRRRERQGFPELLKGTRWRRLKGADQLTEEQQEQRRWLCRVECRALAEASGGDFDGLPVGHLGQADQDIAQVGVGIDLAAAAAFHHAVEDGAALAGLSRADEVPVLPAQGGGVDGVLDQVVVDLEATFAQKDFQRGPWAQGAVEGRAKLAVREVPVAATEARPRGCS